MPRTFLQLIQQAANEIGIPEPTSLFGNVNDTEKQLIALANREVREFSAAVNKNGGWQELHNEHTFITQFLNPTGDTTAGSAVISNLSSTVGIQLGTWGVTGNGFQAGTYVVSIDSPTQVTVSNACLNTSVGQIVQFGQIAYSLPSDLDYFIDKTYWDNKYKWSLIGPITAQEKQILRYGVVASGPRNKFYIRQDKMWLDPVPTANTLIAYDYYSNAPVLTASSVRSTVWTTDNDTYVLDENAFIQGIIWRFMRAKGLDYAEEYEVYQDVLTRLISRDGGSRDLPLGSSGYSQQFLSADNIADGNWPGK